MDTDGGGWTVFQRRMDGSVDFYRNWTDYEQGFGNLIGEHWLGLRKIRRLTANSTSQELRVDLGDFENNTRYAHYENFYVAGFNDKYRLHVSGYNGTAGNSLIGHSGLKFSTRDQDNDDSDGNSAQIFKGAWWHRSVYYYCNLNGLYHDGIYPSPYEGVNWSRWKGLRYSLKFAEMKSRRKYSIVTTHS